MKLVKQANLAFRRGRSDKVYEVDLCEVGPNQYVVNFRYGRRGTALKDGSKTVVAVPLAEAEKVYDKLVSSKVTKGYQQVDPAAISPPPPLPPTPAAPPAQDPLPDGSPYRTSAGGPGAGSPYRSAGTPSAVGRERAVLNRLSRGDRAPRGEWPLDRAIWRAGELALRQAEPLLLNLMDSVPAGKKHLRAYGLIWALGRCGSSKAIPAILRVYQDRGSRPATRRIAAEALRLLYSDADRELFIDGLIGALPAGLVELTRSGPAKQLASTLRTLLEGGDASVFGALHTLYLIDNEHARGALLDVMGDAPLGKDYFQALRAIFKCAEYRHDGEVFGLLAHRFETTRANTWRDWRSSRGVRPFGDATRQYLRLRTWRVLRRMGELQEQDWVKMAVGVLLPFTDDDARAPQETTYWSWQGDRRTVRWGAYSNYWAFNHLLYGNSDRYEPDDRGRAWRSTSTSGSRRGRPGRPARRPGTPGREESFPGLWDRMPQGLLHLMDGSRCEQVHEFGVKALRANPDFLDQLDTGPVTMLLSRPYEITARLGFDLAVRLYNSSAPDWDLIMSVVQCAYGPAREQGRQWIEGQRAAFLADGELVTVLCASPHADNRAFALNLLRSSVLPDEQARSIIGRLFAVLLALGEGEGERVADMAAILIKAFGQQLTGVSVDVVRDLMQHPLAEAQELAGELLMAHAELAGQVPDDILLGLLGSERESVRGIGARLLGQLPDQALLHRQDLLVQLSCHGQPDLRGAIRPVIGRLATSHPLFARRVADMLMAALRRKEPGEGVHSHLLALLKHELRSCIDTIGREEVLQLLHARYPQAQELGGLLLANIDAEELTIRQIVRLASHEILSVRQGCWAMCHKSVERFKQGMPSAVKLLDAKWEDSRAFAFGFFRDNFTGAELTPPILVSICDSVREDVQQFGRELITRYFAEEHGQEYLLKLSEHPSEALQLFATNYLERFAAGDIERLEQLRPYFVTVLSRVNKGRVAKSRCLAFLQQEALADERAAGVAADILTRQSVTMAIGDKASMIEAMVQIGRAYPALELPITEREVEVRRGV